MKKSNNLQQFYVYFLETISFLPILILQLKEDLLLANKPDLYSKVKKFSSKSLDLILLDLSMALEFQINT